jgi:multiple sugar transport system permease protein
MLFFMLFNATGPVNQIYRMFMGVPEIDAASTYLDFFKEIWPARSLIAFLNFIMWFGNTTILLMAGIMGIDQSLFEASSIDGANSRQTFFKVTLPLLVPIIVYVLITALIGGLQMFDVPQIMCGNSGGVVLNSCMTLVMKLNRFIGGASGFNYGQAGVISVYIFVVTAILSLIVFKVTNPGTGKKKARKGGK